jgi:hypothetical protein
MARLLRAGDRAALAPVLPQLTRTMQAIGGPAAGLVLVTGIAMVLVGRLTFRSLWIGLGFGGIVVLGAFGGLVMSKRLAILEQAVASGDDAALAEAGSRVRQASTLLLAIMGSIVAVMILKPAL